MQGDALRKATTLVFVSLSVSSVACLSSIHPPSHRHREIQKKLSLSLSLCVSDGVCHEISLYSQQTDQASFFPFTHTSSSFSTLPLTFAQSFFLPHSSSFTLTPRTSNELASTTSHHGVQLIPPFFPPNQEAVGTDHHLTHNIQPRLVARACPAACLCTHAPPQR